VFSRFLPPRAHALKQTSSTPLYVVSFILSKIQRRQRKLAKVGEKLFVGMSWPAVVVFYCDENVNLFYEERNFDTFIGFGNLQKKKDKLFTKRSGKTFFRG
jgi:hypothetical protein